MKNQPVPDAELDQKNSANQPNCNYSLATQLLAASFYTRGLWSPFIAWLSLARCPFRYQSVDWGIDQGVLKKELKRAMRFATGWLIIQVIIYLAFLRTGSAWLGLGVIWLILLQWFVFPYFAVRGVFKRLGPAISAKSNAKIDTIVLRENEESIPDMGYLLREAIFSVDSTRTLATWEQKHTNLKDAQLTVDEFYTAVEEAFSQNTNGIMPQRLVVLAGKDIRPALRDWKRWLCPESPSKVDLETAGEERMIVLGEHPKVDGLAAIEFTARIINPHASFRIRIRWLPGFKRRLHNLLLMVKQKLWWRGCAVPLVLGIGLVALVVLVGGVIGTLDPEAIGGKVTISKMLSAKVVQADDLPSVWDVPIELFPKLLIYHALNRGGAGILADVAVVIAFLPGMMLIFVLVLRFIRYAWGLFYVATGTYYYVGSKACLRFKYSGSGFEDEESLQTAISYLQVIEQVVTNRIVEVLQAHGVDTSTIRDELKMFVNEGIYMTGGELRASKLLVGRSGVIGNRKARTAKSGRQTVLQRGGK